MGRLKYTKEILEQAVAVSTSMAGVQRALGLRITGGGHAHLRRRINQLGIDTSHFVGQGHGLGKRSPNRYTAAQVLVRRAEGLPRAKSHLLRRAVIEAGVPYRCAGCDIEPLWRGMPLVLHVDHINGDFADCRLPNVRFLCPNCHSQSQTYAGRNLRAVRR